MSLFHSSHLDSIEEDAPAPYFYERITPQNKDSFYRLGDDDDNAIGHCDDEETAKYVIELMNGDNTKPPRSGTGEDRFLAPFSFIEIEPKGRYRQFLIKDANGERVARCGWPGHARLITGYLNR